VIERAVDRGINFIDTANIYSTGDSERIVGSAIDEYDRDELVVATKVYGQMHTGPNGQGLSRKHVLDQAHASLKRLDTDYIDLYQIHRCDETIPVAETLSALDRLVDEGLVRYVGASSMATWRFAKALHVGDVDHRSRFVSMQPEYSLVRRHEEENVLPLCDEEGVGVVPLSPLYRGFLTGKYERSDDPPEGSRMAEEFHDNQWAVLNTVREIAAEHDVTPTQVSLAWLLDRDVVTAPIVGPKTTDQLDENLGALDVSLSDDEVARLEAPIDPAWSADQL